MGLAPTKFLESWGDTIFPTMPASWYFGSFPHDVELCVLCAWKCWNKRRGKFLKCIFARNWNAGWHLVHEVRRNPVDGVKEIRQLYVRPCGGLVDDGGWEPSRPNLYEFLRTYKTIFLKSKQSLALCGFELSSLSAFHICTPFVHSTNIRWERASWLGWPCT